MLAAPQGDDGRVLDALEPTVISRLIRSTVEDLIDPGPWEEALDRQAAGREKLEEVAAELAG